MDKLEQSFLDPVVDHDSQDMRREYSNDQLAFRPPSSNGVSLRGKRGEATRTGPKGVLADWRSTSKAHASQQPVLDRTPSQQSYRSSPQITQTPGLSSGPSSGDELEDEEEEREAVQRYRKQRMDELARAGPVEGRNFGHLREIGIDQFESAVLEEDEAIQVVLHLYEPHIAACAILSGHLSALARLYPRTKFLRAKASDLDFAVDDADDVLPTVLVYQAGELVEKLVAIDREWDQKTSVNEDEVARVLTKHGILSSQPKASPRPPPARQADDNDSD